MKVKKLAQDEELKDSIFNLSFVVHIAVIAILWYTLYYFVNLVNDAPTIMQFDPFEILGIKETEDMKVIKSAYRTMSRKLHPDLNQDDPHANERFMKVWGFLCTLL